MLAFLKANIYNIIVIAVILLVVFLIIRKIVKDKKAGKSAVCVCICYNDADGFLFLGALYD